MEKRILNVITFALLIFVTTACGSKAEDTGSIQIEGQNQPDIPLSTKLMLGTVKLDETEQAVDTEQADSLIPLWKALRSLAANDTTAQAEVDAVVIQIQETMTSDQLDAIEEMGLTMRDTGSIFEILGVESTFGGRFDDITPEMQATMEAMRESGEFPGGGDSPGGRPGFGGGSGQGPGGGDFGGAEMDPSVRETAMAERGGTFGRGFGINTQLLDAFIDFLITKVQ